MLELWSQNPQQGRLHGEGRKLNDREMKDTPIHDPPLNKTLLCSSAHILCINEADAFFEESTKMKELVQTFIHHGTQGRRIEIQSLVIRKNNSFQGELHKALEDPAQAVASHSSRTTSCND